MWKKFKEEKPFILKYIRTKVWKSNGIFLLSSSVEKMLALFHTKLNIDSNFPTKWLCEIDSKSFGYHHMGGLLLQYSHDNTDNSAEERNPN